MATLHLERLCYWDCSADGLYPSSQHTQHTLKSTPRGSSATSTPSSSSWGSWALALGGGSSNLSQASLPPRMPQPLNCSGTGPEFWAHFSPAALSHGMGSFCGESGSAGSLGGGVSGRGGGVGGERGVDEELSRTWGLPVQGAADKAVLLAGLRVDCELGSALVLGGGEEVGGQSSLASSMAGSFMSAAPGEPHLSLCLHLIHLYTRGSVDKARSASSMKLETSCQLHQVSLAVFIGFICTHEGAWTRLAPFGP